MTNDSKLTSILILLAVTDIILQYSAYQYSSEISHHLSFILSGAIIGLLFGRTLGNARIRLLRTKVRLADCGQAINPASKSSCKVIVMKQYCYIVDTPTPHQICFWVKEEQQGEWDSEKECCQVLVDGRKLCVRPNS